MREAISPDPDLQWSTLTPTIILTSLASIIVILRLITRSCIVHSVGFDDWVILLCLFLSWAVCGLTVAEVAEGIDEYTWTQPLDLLPSNAKLVLAWNCLYVALINITKASILLQYLRIFVSRTMRITTYTLLAALLPALLWGLFGVIFLCHPVQKLWHPSLPGHCKNTRGYWISTSTVNILLDFTVFLIPLRPITKLRLPRKQKWGLVLVFLVGFFVCAVSLARVALVHRAYARHDFTRSSIDSFTWSSVEANTGIVCASLLALKPLLLRLFPTLMDEEMPPAYSTTLRVITDSESGSSPYGSGPSSSDDSNNAGVSNYFRSSFGQAAAYLDGENKGTSKVEEMAIEDDVHTLVGTRSGSQASKTMQCSSADSITLPLPTASRLHGPVVQ